MGGDFKNNRKQAERPPKMVFKADLAGSKEYTISIIDMEDRDDGHETSYLERKTKSGIALKKFE